MTESKSCDMIEVRRYPGFYPSVCPPEDAIPASGQVYRCIKGEVVSAQEFLSWKELNPERSYSNSCKECEACGISVLRDRRDVLRLIQTVPAMRKCRCAVGLLTPDMGVIKHTPSHRSNSHYTWWTPIGVCRHAPFQILPNELDET